MVLQEPAKYQRELAVEFKSNMLAAPFSSSLQQDLLQRIHKADCFIHDVEIKTLIYSERQPQKHQKVTVGQQTNRKVTEAERRRKHQ